jgi:hypothetical protein
MRDRHTFHWREVQAVVGTDIISFSNAEMTLRYSVRAEVRKQVLGAIAKFEGGELEATSRTHPPTDIT